MKDGSFIINGVSWATGSVSNGNSSLFDVINSTAHEIDLDTIFFSLRQIEFQMRVEYSGRKEMVRMD